MSYRGSQPSSGRPAPVQHSLGLGWGGRGKPVCFVGAASRPIDMPYPPRSAVLVIKIIFGIATPLSSSPTGSELGWGREIHSPRYIFSVLKRFLFSLSQWNLVTHQTLSPAAKKISILSQEMKESICISSFLCRKEGDGKTVQFLYQTRRNLALYSMIYHQWMNSTLSTNTAIRTSPGTQIIKNQVWREGSWEGKDQWQTKTWEGRLEKDLGVSRGHQNGTGRPHNVRDQGGSREGITQSYFPLFYNCWVFFHMCYI